MPLEGPLPGAADRALALNASYRHHAAVAVLAHALDDAHIGRIALVSSFGAESVVLLHMVATLDRATPVLFLDTGKHFPETLAYQRDVTAELGLTHVEVLHPDPADLAAGDPDGALHLKAPDRCCALRKTQPLEAALGPYDAWVTGRKRYQGGARATLEHFETDGARIKVNPLAHWQPGDVRDYIDNNRLPRHPLVARGYPSIGCAPCTSAASDAEDARAGRWRGQDKAECGIHFQDGQATRRVRQA